MVKRIHAVYFSAVANTKRVVTELAGMICGTLRDLQSCGEGTGLPVMMPEDDFTLPEARKQRLCFGPEDLVVFGMPTYAGRVPNKVLPFVQELFRGSGTLAIPVVTFGNRSFDSSLAELCRTLESQGFRPFAAAAAACSHVFSDTLGSGRPDREDTERLQEFAGKAAEKLLKLKKGELPVERPDLGEQNEVRSYYTPLGTDGKPAKFLKAKPKTDLSKCDRCGICAKVCPMGSVDPSDITLVPGVCIKCHACIRKCPQRAKYFDDPAFLSHRDMLEQNYQRRAEMFLAL